MDRRAFIVGSVAALAAPLAAEAQQAGRVYRIGFLTPGPVPPPSPERTAFFQTLSEFGLVAEQNVVADRVGAEGRLERLPMLAISLINRKVDVIVAVSSAAVQAAKQATTVIPIVMVGPADPVGDGFIASLARPGGNITGVANLNYEIETKALQLITELHPNSRRLVVVIPRASAASARLVDKLQETGAPMRLSVKAVEVSDVKELEKSFDAILAARPDALWFYNPALGTAEPRTVQLPLAHNVPALYINPRAVQLGGLLSYGEHGEMLWRRVARYVGRILQGTSPADLPAEQATQIRLAV